jgi:hypothetical protein
MKIFVAVAGLALACGITAFAVESSAPQQTILLVPLGTWAMCAANASIGNSPFCEGLPAYVKGQEPDLLLVTASRPDTVAFAYTITGVDISGDTKTWSGAFLRNDRPPSVIASYTIVNAGALRNAVITIQELSSTLTLQRAVDASSD